MTTNRHSLFLIQTQQWLILFINLTGLRDAQIADKTLFLGVCMRVLVEQISILVSRQSKFCFYQYGLHHLIHCRPQIVQKGKIGRENSHSLLELRHPSSPAFGTSEFLVLRNLKSRIYIRAPPTQPLPFSNPTTLALLVLRPSVSTDLYHHFPGSPACWQYMVGFLSVQSHEPITVINFLLYIYI